MKKKKGKRKYDEQKQDYFPSNSMAPYFDILPSAFNVGHKIESRAEKKKQDENSAPRAEFLNK